VSVSLSLLWHITSGLIISDTLMGSTLASETEVFHDEQEKL